MHHSRLNVAKDLYVSNSVVVAGEQTLTVNSGVVSGSVVLGGLGSNFVLNNNTAADSASIMAATDGVGMFSINNSLISF